MSDCLLWAVTWKLHKYPTYLGYYITWIRLSVNLDENG
jgi:hypothetical protein